MMLLPVRFKTMTKSATVVTGGTRGLLWKPYLTVVEEAMMSWSIQFVVKHERPIVPSKHTGGEIVDSQPVVNRLVEGVANTHSAGNSKSKAPDSSLEDWGQIHNIRQQRSRSQSVTGHQCTLVFFPSLDK